MNLKVLEEMRDFSRRLNQQKHECHAGSGVMTLRCEPLSVAVECFGTAAVDEETLGRPIRAVFDLMPEGINPDLDLLRPIYRATAAYGHFGRREPGFTWERTNRIDALRAAALP